MCNCFECGIETELRYENVPLCPAHYKHYDLLGMVLIIDKGDYRVHYNCNKDKCTASQSIDKSRIQDQASEYYSPEEDIGEAA